ATLLTTRRASSARRRTIRVDFHDDTLVDASTITAGGIVVVGANGFSPGLKLIWINPSDDSSVVAAAYTGRGRKAGRDNVMASPRAQLRDGLQRASFGGFAIADGVRASPTHFWCLGRLIPFWAPLILFWVWPASAVVRAIRRRAELRIVSRLMIGLSLGSLAL